MKRVTTAQDDQSKLGEAIRQHIVTTNRLLALLAALGTLVTAAALYAGLSAWPKAAAPSQLLAVATLPAAAQPQPDVTPTPQPRAALAKQVAQDFGPRATWTMTPLPSATPTPTVIPTFVGYTDGVRPFGVGDSDRWIDIDLSRQSLTAYEGDRAVFSTLISSGLPQYATVTGQFRIWLRYRTQTMDGRRLGYDYVVDDVPYVMYFYEDYAIHGAYWHNNFGSPMSHGCVNMHPEEAAWLFSWASIGTVVNVHY